MDIFRCSLRPLLPTSPCAPPVRRFQTVKSADRVTFSGEITAFSVTQITDQLFKALKKKKLMLCFDVDGTLLPYNEGFEVFTNKKIDDFLRLVQETYKANNNKIGVTILTGRSVQQVHALFKDRLHNQPVCILGEDGGSYYNCLTREEHTTATNNIHRAIKTVQNRLKQLKLKIDKNITQEITATRLAWFGTPKEIEVLHKQIKEFKWSLIDTSEDEHLEKARSKFPLKLKNLYNIVQIAPKSFDKANGLSMLVNKLKLKPSDNYLFHIGDGRNDFPAFGFIRHEFKNSGLGVLVGRFKPKSPKKPNDPPETSPPAHGYLVPEQNAKAQPKLQAMSESRLLTKTVWWLVERFGEKLQEANNRKELK